MSDQGGTPKTLRLAIRGALLVGPLKDAEDRLVAVVHDFLAQRFGATILIQNKLAEETLMQLFRDITEEFLTEGKKK